MNKEGNTKFKKTGDPDIGQRFDQVRQYLKLTKSEMSQQMDFSNSNYVNHIINGTRSLTLKHMVRLSQILKGLNFHWLFKGEGEMMHSGQGLDTLQQLHELKTKLAETEQLANGLDRERKVLFDTVELLTRRYLLDEVIDSETSGEG
ncbi:MAG: helix-turn-helix transcriptional regulator [Bacteroidota bacterium]